MKPRSSFRDPTPLEELETCYWLYWCGDELYARNRLIKFTDNFLKGKPPNVKAKTQSKNVLLPVGGTDADDYRGAFAD